MASKVFTEYQVKGIQRGDIFGGWELAQGDVAVPLVCPRYSDKSIQIFGEWDGATVALQASNDPELVNFQEAYDFEGVVISQTADRKPWVIFPNVYAIKPVISNAGPNTNLKVAIVGKGVGV